MSRGRFVLFAVLRGAFAALLVGGAIAAQLRLTLAAGMESAMSVAALDAKAAKNDQAYLWSLEDAVIWNPHNYHAQYRLGVYHMEAQEHEAAQAAFEACLTKSPGHLGALLAMADLNTMAGKPEEASVFLKQAIAVAPTSWRAYLSAGTLASTTESWDEAIALLEKADHLARFPQIGVYNQLALTQLQSGKPETAIDIAELSLATRRRNPEAALVKGKALIELERYEDAIESLEFAIQYFVRKKHPLQRSDARLQLAHALTETGRIQEASKILLREVRGSVGSAYLYATSLRLCELLEKRLTTTKLPVDTIALLEVDLGFIYAALDKLPEAAERFAAAEATGVELEISSLWGHAETLLRLDRVAEAIQRYEAALTRGATPPQIRLGFADALAKAGRTADARLQYQLVLQNYVLDSEERARVQALLDALN